MADRFMTLTHCERCGGSLKGGRILSMYSTECICMTCKDAERQRDDYPKAVAADHDAIRRGDYNYKGIGWKK